MRRLIVLLLAVGSYGLSAAAAEREAAAQPKTDANAPYEEAAQWPQLAHPYAHAGYVLGSQSAIFAESPNRIFLGGRGELKLPEKLPPTFNGFWGSLFPDNPDPDAARQIPDAMHNTIIVVDANGKLVESWTQWDFLFDEARGPHSIRISPYDPERHVWAIDDYHHQIYEFSNDGQTLVRTLGVRNVAGEDGAHFRHPTDIAWLPDGTFFVSDGEGNARVAKFDRYGKFLLTWGKEGTAPGEFNNPHSIAVGPDRRVYVADRFNKRIQVFDENGKFITLWPDIRTATLVFSANGHLWGYDSDTRRYVEYDLNGKIVSAFSTPERSNNRHQISADAEGNLYAADAHQAQPIKFRPKAGADPSKLLRPVALMGKEVSTKPGNANFSGSWKLTSSDSKRSQGIKGFGAIAPAITITQTATDLTFTNGPVKLTYNLNGAEIVDRGYIDPETDQATKTTARWDGNKLILLAKQGLNHSRDTLSLDQGALSIERDINVMVGNAYTTTLTYTKQ